MFISARRSPETVLKPSLMLKVPIQQTDSFVVFSRWLLECCSLKNVLLAMLTTNEYFLMKMQSDAWGVK